MWRREKNPALYFLFVVVTALVVSAESKPQVHYEVNRNVSLPLRDMARNEPPIPMKPGPMHEPGSRPLPAGPRGEDTVVQNEVLPLVQATTLVSREGIPADHAGGLYPPDTNGAAGSTQFFEIVNLAFVIYDKTTGQKLLGPKAIHTIWQGFAGPCGKSDGGDPVVLWDKMAQRWLVSQLEINGANLDCVAVSTSADATGSYNRYAYSYNGEGPDYPKFSVWPDAYYQSINAYGQGFGEPCAYDRSAMIAGNAAAQICFSPDPRNFSMLPSDLDGARLPPTGEPAHFIELGNNTNKLTYWDFHVDFGNPQNSTFTGPNNITVPAYVEACGGGGFCIPQPPGGNRLDSLGDRLMFRDAYRNFGDHESMVVTHSVVQGPGSAAASALRWYELRATPPGSGFTLYQAGTFQDKAISFWMGSIAMDKMGDIAIGFSASSPKVYPSIGYTGRVPGDPPGKMESPKMAVTGSAVQIDSERWGDYSSMSVDPTDDCTFWYSQEYYNIAHGGLASLDWSTRVTAFRFQGCK